MIRKVLIAEDHESANISVQKTLEELSITNVDIVYYCDDAQLRIEKALQAGQSYDLLITDLYFEVDHRQQKLAGGIPLIDAARKAQPDLRILVFSAENKPGIIGMLYKTYSIDGFVRKARNDARELKTAITQISQNQRYLPPQLVRLEQQQHAHAFTEFDITIISLLADGVPQKNIPEHLQRNNIKPSGLSSVEKRLNHMRDVLQFSKNEQLVAFCKDMGII